MEYKWELEKTMEKKATSSYSSAYFIYFIVGYMLRQLFSVDLAFWVCKGKLFFFFISIRYVVEKSGDRVHRSAPAIQPKMSDFSWRSFLSNLYLISLFESL